MTTLAPVRTIAIFGGGQLGLMLANAARPLGIRSVFLEDAPNCPAALAGEVMTNADYDKFANACDTFTLEFENTPLSSAQGIESHAKLYPPSQALFIAQDRLNEKNLFNELGITTVPFLAVNSQDELNAACEKLGLPLVLKTTRGGYDGKGQFVIRTQDDIKTAWAELGDATKSAPLIAEGFINFSREVSLIAVRAQDGDIRYYPLVENTHHNGILAKTVAPAPSAEHLNEQAQSSIKKLLEHLNYVGVMTLELFVTDSGLIANEIAPRVHNSGHWSIEGAVCSQFENHMRAVAGLPLGSTDIIKPSVMLNVIGKYPNLQDVLAIDGVHFHHYHKDERDGRKIGHITIMCDELEETVLKVEQLLK
ncbi:phosphoribosylaminoimidazole carboxylase ATPase subunit [Moraxella bovoculi 237]|uniref:N5-carboxyaminoimidazole ribonucleotide synthase n=1 Tax=Moraxella bovoculi 237 TaxID=743974 RepID=A0A066UHJ3_9GAMM|nr:5-(carboxyamino)imidazole ribonucleotide synthase [Moraxella bovoculi]KDN25342.1 phosphoribosylaminoimidazole carboxylase ATPase subunit [Moraxella bovoculi 237]